MSFLTNPISNNTNSPSSNKLGNDLPNPSSALGGIANSSAATSIEKKQNKNKISTQNWVQFAVQCFVAIFITLGIGLLGANFLFFITVTANDKGISGLDDFFPSSENDFPYNDNNKNTNIESELYIPLLWYKFTQLWNRFWNNFWNKFGLRFPSAAERMSKRYKNDEQSGGGSRGGKQKTGRKQSGGDLQCAKQKQKNQNTINNKILGETCIKPSDVCMPNNTNLKALFNKKVPSGPISSEIIDSKNGNKIGWPYSLRTENKLQEGDNNSDVTLWKSFKNWFANTCIYSWIWMRDILKWYFKICSKFCQGEITETITFLLAPAILFLLFFPLFNLCGLITTAAASFCADWTIGIFGIFLASILPGLQSLSLIFTLTILPLLISPVTVKKIMGRHFKLLTVIYGILVNQYASTYLGSSIGTIELLSVFFLYFIVVRPWGKSKSD